MMSMTRVGTLATVGSLLLLAGCQGVNSNQSSKAAETRTVEPEMCVLSDMAHTNEMWMEIAQSVLLGLKQAGYDAKLLPQGAKNTDCACTLTYGLVDQSKGKSKSPTGMGFVVYENGQAKKGAVGPLAEDGSLSHDKMIRYTLGYLQMTYGTLPAEKAADAQIKTQESNALQK